MNNQVKDGDQLIKVLQDRAFPETTNPYFSKEETNVNVIKIDLVPILE